MQSYILTAPSKQDELPRVLWELLDPKSREGFQKILFSFGKKSPDAADLAVTGDGTWKVLYRHPSQGQTRWAISFTFNHEHSSAVRVGLERKAQAAGLKMIKCEHSDVFLNWRAGVI